jgi:pimeloyl-ACP methyl ester carboxylesterase
MKEMYEVGNRPGHYRAFISLLRNAASWDKATEVYRNINVPVCLVWGEKDWANSAERARDHKLLPGSQMTTVANGGHFLPLDRQRELTDLIVRFARQ